MQIQERLIVPGLGVVILLAAFILGVPLVYKLLLGLLGLAATGTFFTPHAVQVETRIAIAALGLIILLIISSTAFWLILLSFGAIAALQIPHRHTLQRSSATIAWLNTVLERRSGAPTDEAAGSDPGEEAAAVAAAGDGKSAQAPAPSGADTLPGFVRMNLAGVGSAVLGVLALLSVFMPWVIFMVTYNDEWENTSYTLLAAADTLEIAQPRVFLIILLVLGLLSIASIVLPRAVTAIVAVAGFGVTSFSWIYLFGEQLFAKALLGDFIPPGVGAITLPYLGALLATFCFMVIFLLQLIPGLNRSRDKG